MFLDALALLSDAQSSTVSVASTDYLDLDLLKDAAGNTTFATTGQQYNGCFFVFRVDTAFTSSGTTTCTIQLQSSNDSSFLDSTTVTLAASSAFTASQLTAGKMWVARIPPTGVKRYVRGYKVMSANTGANYWTACVYDMFITPDVDVAVAQRYVL